MKPTLQILTGGVNYHIPSYAESPEVGAYWNIVKWNRVINGVDLVYTQNVAQCIDELELCSVPYVIHFGGSPFLEMRPAMLKRMMWVAEKAAAILCVSRFVRGEFRKRVDWSNIRAYPAGLWGMKHTPIGVQPDRFTPKDSYKLHTPAKALISMNLVDNRIKRTKWRGILTLLESVGAYARMRGIRFFNSGKGDLEFSQLVEWDKICGYFKMIRTHHLMGRDRWPHILKRADVFIHPSMFDSWSRVVADAMCAGVPCLVFDHTGPPEVSRTQLTCDPDDRRDILVKFQSLYEDHSYRKELGLRGREEALMLTEKHRWDLVAILNRVRRGQT